MNDIDRDIDKEREKYLISIADAYGLMPFSSEFSNFLNAKGKKLKVGNLKKGLQKLGGQIKDAGKSIGKGVAKVVVAVPRTAFLSLLDLNYRGYGWKMQSIMVNPALKKEKEKLKKKWEQLGGKFSALEKTAGIGSRREKAFFCGKKCKTQLVDKDFSKQSLENLGDKETNNFSNFNINSNFFTGSYIDTDSKYSNIAEPASASAVAIWVGAGASVLGALAGIISKGIESADQKKMLIAEEEKTKLELASISESEKKKIELAEKQLKAQSDPRDIILKNENLTPAEKKEALEVVDEATSKTDSSKIKKYIIYGGIALVILLVIFQVTKKK
jgi:hypothetical protein